MNKHNPIEEVFENDDLRQKVFKHRTESMIPFIVKNIYKPWHWDERTRELYINGKSGPSAEHGSFMTRWSISPLNFGNIDDTPIIITDTASMSKDKYSPPYQRSDGLMNDAHIEIKKEPWYIPSYQLRRFVISSPEQEAREYFDWVYNYKDIYREKLLERMDIDMIRRNDSADFIVYKIPQY
tara:strand:- start:3342 stop:3887 length:546 start_codon:yes stop_codon:yes gene_type:complete